MLPAPSTNATTSVPPTTSHLSSLMISEPAPRTTTCVGSNVEEWEPFEWPRRKIPPKPWAGALPEEYKQYPFEEDVEFGEDPTLLDPWRDGPEGDELIRRCALVSLRQLERKRWIYHPYTKKVTRQPDPKIWRLLRGPPGEPLAEEDVAGIGSRERRDALRRTLDLIAEEEREAEEKRRVGCQRPQTDKFYEDLCSDSASGWGFVRRYARIVACAKRNIHRSALLSMGWWVAELEARKEKQEAEGVILSELEEKRRYCQRVADFQENEEMWETKKKDEMKVWLKIELEREKAGLEEGDLEL